MTQQQHQLLLELYNTPYKLGHLLGYKDLLPIHGEWIKQVFLAKKDHVLMAHRGSYKTTAISVVGSIWCLLFWPNETILMASSTATHATNIVKEAKAAYNNQKLLKLYSFLGVNDPRDQDNWQASSITLSTRTKPSKQGSLDAISVGANMTGRHYSKIVCDDIVALKDRYSKAEREMKRNWIKDIPSIINPGRAVSYVGTPYHKDDVYRDLPPAVKYPVGTTGIPGFDAEYCQQLKEKQGMSFYSSQYLLELVDEHEGLFGEPHWGTAPEGGRLLAYLDPAFGGADYSALTIGKKIGEHFYITAGYIWQGQIDITYTRTEQICKAKLITNLFVEANQAQRLIIPELRRRGLAVSGVVNNKNKHLRIMDAVKKNWDKILFDPDIDPDYIQQVAEYNETIEHDDAPDSLAGLIAQMNTNNKAQAIDRLF